jgi:hypothetical protein
MEFNPAIDKDFVAAVLERWRGATADQKPVSEDSSLAERAPLAPQAGHAGLALDPDRFKLLKRTLTPGG